MQAEGVMTRNYAREQLQLAIARFLPGSHNLEMRQHLRELAADYATAASIEAVDLCKDAVKRAFE